MKSLFIVLVTAAVASANQVCSPGTYFRTECNTCVCSKDGSASICTQKQCPPGLFNWDGSLKVPLDIIQQIIPDVTEIEIFESQLIAVGGITYVQICTPNSFFYVNCNRCRCSEHGIQYDCEKNVCPVQPHFPAQSTGHRVARSVKKVCEPNEVFKNDCNTCACNKDGTTAACTLMKCNANGSNNGGISPFEDHHRIARSTKNQVCEPNTNFKKYCNQCRCLADGTNYSCTKMGCDKNIYNKDGSFKKPYICEPGSSYNNYCNTCICSKDGRSVVCTRKYCNKTVFNKDGTLKAPYNVIRPARSVSTDQQLNCEPGKLFKQYCNQCICSDDGSDYACTRKLCDKDVFNKDGTLKTPLYCEPNSHFKDYCNDCQCSVDGLNAACTAKACNPAIYNKDGSLKNPVKARLLLSNEEVKENWGPVYLFGDPCEAGKSFYSECNQCVCLNDGKSAYCTMKMCYKFNEIVNN